MSREVFVFKASRTKYLNGLQIQKFFEIQSKSRKKFLNTLILTEHEPVYTIGIRDKSYNEADENRLKKLGAEFHRTNRGGLITFHGPGQLVVYPIINLKNFKPSMRWYIANIELAVIDVCKKFGINATTTKDTGIWVNDNKICAIGVHASRYVTTHGLALNCNTDLTWFDHITPCGIIGKGVTSLSNEIEQSVTVEKVIPTFLSSFEKNFNCKLIHIDKDETENILNSCTKM